MEQRGNSIRSVGTLPQHDLQMPLGHRHKAVIPLHVRVRGTPVRNLETTIEVREDEVELCVREIDADAHARAPREGQEFILHFPRVAGGICEPAFGPERLGVFEGVRVLVVDVAAGSDAGLGRRL